MSRLIYTECGRVSRYGNEELTRWRWACKQFDLRPDEDGAPADLWLLLGEHAGNQYPLHVQVNGRDLADVQPGWPVSGWKWSWRKVALPAGVLRAGENRVVFTSDSPAMNSWILALEPQGDASHSFRCTDRGLSWQNRFMGAHSAVRGEYVVRLRVHTDSAKDAHSPSIKLEDPTHERVRELLSLIPTAIRDIADPGEQLLALRSHVAGLWGWQAAGIDYAPWDAWTVPHWASSKSHRPGDAITMCVHFAAVFSALASALGHPARCAAVTGDLNGTAGHFVSEIHDERSRGWVAHDAMFDAHFESNGKLLSMTDLCDLAQERVDLTPYATSGPAFADRTNIERQLWEQHVLTGEVFRICGIWSRNDYTSRPESAPPSHGAMPYCETDFVWYVPTDQAKTETEMFPHRVSDRLYLDRL